MAELKYNLALVDTQKDRKIQPQIWYKERLQTKYIKSLKPTDTSKYLIGRNWIFLKDGLDDFRDGLPPAVEGEVFVKTEKGSGPNINGSDGLLAVKQPAVHNRFNKYQVCYSQITPQQQQRREHIEEIEYGLLQHPLALYPHLEESVPPELFEDIVDILDPEMNMGSEVGSLPEEPGESMSSGSGPAEEPVKSTEPLSSDRVDTDLEEGVVRNPYRWLPRKEEKKDKRKTTEKRSISPSQEEHISNVTTDFCNWVAGLGGESNNIEESTITSLFASGYETKPALSVPIHVVELTNVPQELRMSAAAPQEQSSKNLPPTQEEDKRWMYSGNYEPSWAKFKYGAWYLPPKGWQKRNWEEPLIDPKELKNQEMSDAKKKSHDLNMDLSQMHGSNAFMEFIDKKNTRKPQFLEQVAAIQRKQAEEEMRKLESEALAKQKRSFKSIVNT